jgi:hypothetical protein
LLTLLASVPGWWLLADGTIPLSPVSLALLVAVPLAVAELLLAAVNALADPRGFSRGGLLATATVALVVAGVVLVLKPEWLFGLAEPAWLLATPSTHFDHGPAGPSVPELTADILGLKPEQRRTIDRILQKTAAEYLRMEESHTSERAWNNQTGHLHVTIDPFPKVLEALKEQAWADMDAVLDEKQQKLARERLRIDELFNWAGRERMSYDIWKEGGRFVFSISRQGPTSTGSSGPSLPGRLRLPEELRRHWESNTGRSTSRAVISPPPKSEAPARSTPGTSK